MKTMKIIVLLMAAIFLWPDAPGMSDTQQRTGTGAAAGAAAGAAIGSFYGSAGAGAAIGAAVGGAGGYIYDQQVKKKTRPTRTATGRKEEPDEVAWPLPPEERPFTSLREDAFYQKPRALCGFAGAEPGVFIFSQICLYP